MKDSIPSWVRSDRNYGPIRRSLWSELQRVPYSESLGLRYHPCSAILLDGSIVESVYLLPKLDYINAWGVWPEEDRHKRSIRIEDVAGIVESPRRLPARWATEIYEGGETAMGGILFCLKFSDGSSQRYHGGSVIDFVPLPSGRGFADIVGVEIHARSAAPSIGVLPFSWCLYDGVEEEAQPGATDNPGDAQRLREDH